MLCIIVQQHLKHTYTHTLLLTYGYTEHLIFVPLNSNSFADFSIQSYFQRCLRNPEANSQIKRVTCLEQRVRQAVLQLLLREQGINVHL